MNDCPAFAFTLDAFLVLYLKSDQSLTGPLTLRINGEELQRPFLGIPIKELGECFVVARLSPKLKRRNSQIEVLDNQGKRIAWHEKVLAPPPHGIATRVPQTAIPLLCARLLTHLEANFGALNPDSWRRLIADLAGLTQTTFLPLADGRVYFRVFWPATERRTVVEFRLASSEDKDHGERLVGLLEAGWLHAACHVDHRIPSRERSLFAQVANNAFLPIAFTEERRLVEQADPVEAILQNCPGDPAVLSEFLQKALNIRTPSDRTSEQKPSAIRGVITGLRGTRLEGWAVNEDDPGAHVRLDVYVDGERQGSVIADRHNSLHGEALRHGHHSFSWECSPFVLNGEKHVVALRLSADASEISREPFLLGKNHFDGEFFVDEGCRIKGWVRERCCQQAPLTLQANIDGAAIGQLNLPLHEEPSPTGFSIELPNSIQDGARHMLGLEVFRGGQRIAILGPMLGYQARFRGYLERVAPGMVSGWIINESAPSISVALDLYVNGRKVSSLTALQVRGDLGGACCGFEFALPRLMATENCQSISLFIAGTHRQVLGSDRVLTPFESVLRSLNDVSRYLKCSELSPGATEWVRRQLLAPLMAGMRKSATVPQSMTLNLSPVVQAPHPRRYSPVVDVIVPVYAGRQETLACLESVMRSGGNQQFQLVVVNDQSPDLKLSETLRFWAKNRRLTLLENRHNVGFVASVNRGMRLHPDRDVVLLNADTVVPPHWLDRMRRVAYGSPGIGTVTPFSNNATICSFPVPNEENEIPEGWTVDSLDAEFERMNHGRAIDLPTAIGFCMYIKRQVIEEIGFFDEDQWGKGYCEENDFSLRAATLGWRNVLACGVFVQHRGSVSFAGDKARLISSHLETLHRLYPDYSALVQKFIEEDHPAVARNPVAKLLLKRHAPRYMLFVTHTLGGGTKVATDDLAERLVSEGEAVLELAARPNGAWELRAYGTPCVLVYQPGGLAELAQDLKELSVWHVHHHQTLSFPLNILDLPKKLAVPYDVTIHDYLVICPRINMIDETGWYCGQSQHSPQTCDRCVAALGLEPGVESLYAEHGCDTAAWRERYRQMLLGARCVYVPSKDAESRIRQHFELNNLVYRPHPEPQFSLRPPPPAVETQVQPIAILGAIGPHKGYDLLLACARSAAKDGLPLRFIVIGYTCADHTLLQLSNVVITGRYRREELPDLIQKYDCRIAAFLSPWPETHCYALTEAWQNGLYPVAFDLGAQAERIRAAGYGELIPWTTNPKDINMALLTAAQKKIKPKKGVKIGQPYASVLRDYYELAPPRSVTGSGAGKYAITPLSQVESPGGG